MDVLHIVLVIAGAVAGVGPPPFEKEEGIFPPPLPLRLLNLPGFILRDGLLKLEVYGVYGSCCLALVLHGFFQYLLLSRTMNEWVIKLNAEQTGN